MKKKKTQAIAGRGRRGLAVLWVLMILTLLSAVIGIILSQQRSSRSLLDQRQKRLQADWLARAGIEVAAARLLAKGQPFKGDLTDLLANSKVHIEIHEAPGSKTTYILRSEAYYPTDEPRPVTRNLSRELRRVVEKGSVRLEPTSGNSGK
jgi:hypothetical protein